MSKEGRTLEEILNPVIEAREALDTDLPNTIKAIKEYYLRLLPEKWEEVDRMTIKGMVTVGKNDTIDETRKAIEEGK